MSDTIEVTASLIIRRPAAEVRAQYRDMDHHIRNNVHAGIRLEWLQGEAGQRKIKTTFRVLGIPRYDIALLEDAPDGTFLIRNVEGTNAGMTVYHRFVPIDDQTTDVQLRAEAPATLGRRLLGPVFTAGTRQVLKKALQEDKRDLEGGNYSPGNAAGNVDGAIATLKSVRPQPAEVKHAILEAACLVSVADGVLDGAEIDAIMRMVHVLRAHGDKGSIDARARELLAVASTDKIAAEADRIGGILRDAGVGREGVTAAAIIGLVSEGLSLGELSLLRRLALAAGVPDADIAPLIENADATLNRG